MDDNDEENLIFNKDTEEDDYQEIDPNDLDIIDNPSIFKPTKEMILAYAKLIGYKPEEDPEEMLKISEKYLTCELPEPIIRAFTKSEHRILYIDKETRDILLEIDLDEKARREIDEFRKKYKNQKKSRINNTEEELKKKLNEQKKYNDNLKYEDNIQIVDNEEEDHNEEEEDNEEKEHNEEKKLNNSLNENNNSNENKNKNLNIKDNNNIYKKNEDNNVKNDISNEEKYDDFDDFFVESSKSSNDDKEQKKAIKSKNFEEEEKKDEKKEEKEKSNNDNNKKNEHKLNHQNSFQKNEDEIIISNKNVQKSPKIIKKNISEENIIKDELKEKRNYLEISKMNLNNYRIKLQKNYIQNKKDFISKYSDIITENLRKKKLLQISQNSLEDLDIYEFTLKQKMEHELKRYKNNLITDCEYNGLNQSYEEIESLKKKYEIKKLKLESDIRIQKERNKNLEENLLKRNKSTLENKTFQLEEMFQNKKSKLNQKHKKDINELEKKFQNDYDEYETQYKIDNQDDIKLSNSVFNNNLKEQEEEFTNEIKEKFEQQKITIKYELETKMLKELEAYKTQEKINKEQELNKIHDKINNLSSDYFNEIDFIKKNYETQKKNDDEFIYEKIQQIGNSFFNELKNKIIGKVDEEMKQISILINQNDNYNNREFYNDNELQIEEKLIDKFVSYNSKLGGKRSLYDLLEKEYIEIKLKIEYISKAISIISKLLIEKGSNISFDLNSESKKENNDSLLVNEIISNLENKLDEFKLKYKDNTNNIIYPFINEEIKNLLDNIRNIKARNKFKYNNYQNYSSMNAKRINIDDSINLISQLNPTYNSYRFPIQEKKTIKSFSQNKNKNNINNRNDNSINKITEQNSEKENGTVTSKSINNNNDKVNLELSKEFLTEFPQELKNLYWQIISFLKEESASIEKEKQDLNNQDMMNSNLQNLQKNESLKQYKNDFDIILSQEKINSRNNKTNLENRIKLFEKIKSFWEETIYYIYNNYSSSEQIKIKLNNIIGNISDYKQRFNNGKFDIDERLTNNKRFMEKNYNSLFYNNNKFNNRYSSADKNYN